MRRHHPIDDQTRSLVDIDAVKAELRHYAAGGPVPDTSLFPVRANPRCTATSAR
jgi:hypothetical protein